MPQGKGTYGSKVGRPPKKKGSLLNDDRQQYAEGTKTYIDPSPEGDKPILTERTKELNNVYNNIISVMDKTDKSFKKIVKDRISKGNLTEAAGKDLERLHSITLAMGESSSPEWTAPRVLESVFYKEKGRTKKAEGGDIEDQMEGLAISVEPVTVEKEIEEQQLPDEEMEADYVDFVVDSTLSEEDKNYLESALAEDAKLSELFDQVVESASEFSGSGPIEGPGTEVSDSIPARLSDGEFVFTAKATEEIGEDSLMSMMKDAEAAADERQGVVHGGMVEDEGDPKAVPIQTRGSIAAQGNIPNVAKQSRQVEEEMLKSSPRRYYVPVSG